MQFKDWIKVRMAKVCGLEDKVAWKTKWTIEKYKDEDGSVAQAKRSGLLIDAKPYSVEVVENNLALNEGLQALIGLLAGTSAETLFNNANAYIGVGDSSTSAVASQVGLQASTNKLYKGMDVGYPARTNQTCEWRATFGTSEANFAWNEYTVANGNSDSAKNLNRKVESKGTKVSGETWTISVQITFS